MTVKEFIRQILIECGEKGANINTTEIVILAHDAEGYDIEISPVVGTHGGDGLPHTITLRGF